MADPGMPEARHAHAHGPDDQAGHDHTGHHNAGPAHDAHQGHGQAHGHAHAPADYGRSFALGVGLNTSFIVLEVVAGLWADSLALLADAGHNLSDVAALLLAWGAFALARRPPTRQRTYGFGRSTILASLVNALALLFVMGAVAWEAVIRLRDPPEVASTIVVVVALAGVIVNGGTAWLFMSGRRGDVNIRGAFLHMAGDAGVSLGVAVAALLIGLTGWLRLDPLVTLLICGLIVWTSWGLLRDSLDLAMDAVPPGVDRDAVETYLASLPGVTAVHDLHIWGLSSSTTALTAHLVRPTAVPDDAFLFATAEALRTRFRIGHATLQVEQTAAACELADPGRV